MKGQKHITMNLWGNKLWYQVLWPFSLLYGLGVRIRNMLYSLKVLSSFRLKAKVISVGNITVGGTGKTPLVEKLARFLRDEGRRVAVLSRGYGRYGKKMIVVSDGKAVKGTPYEAGDEPFLLARRLTDVPIIVGKDRAKTGKFTVEKFKSDTFLLDDGFQHRKLKRDFDFVVLDSNSLWGNRRLIPAGPLREPLSGLRRADAVVFSRVDEIMDLEDKVSQVRKLTQAPILFTFHRPVEWVSIKKENVFPLDLLNGKRVLCFAGIGNPESFQRTLQKVGVEIINFLEFKDHYYYKKSDLSMILQKAKNENAEAIVTTEKDGIKVPNINKDCIPIYYLRINLEIQGEAEELNRVLGPVLML